MNLFANRRARQAAAQAWYDHVLSQSRNVEPYKSGWVEDSFDGRFGLLSVVAIFALRRLREAKPDGRDIADRFYKLVFSGLDYALREEGVGDATIARKVRGYGEEFFGLARAIDEVMAEEIVAAVKLADVLSRNAISQGEYSFELASWGLVLSEQMAALSDEQVLVADLLK